MKTKIVGILMLVVMLLSTTSVVFAAEVAEYTIDVRNRTGAAVELNYRGADGILRWVTIPEGVSSLTLNEGVYSYWASTSCGNIAGDMNVSQQRQILWVTCDEAVPALQILVPGIAGGCQYYGWWDSDLQNYIDGDSGAEQPDIYLIVDGSDPSYVAANGPGCIDSLMDAFYSMPGWQIREINSGGGSDVIEEDPDFFI